MLDDTYNANPHSVARALETLAQLRGSGRALAVAKGTQADGDFAGSGLMTVAFDKRLVSSQRKEFGYQGDPLRDADAWSRKGMLRTVLELAPGWRVELYSTHLFNGGGILDQIMHDLEISVDPADIPPHIVVDVTTLTIGHSIHAGEIPLPAGVTLVSDPDATVCVCGAPKVEAEPVAVEAAAATPAEPDLIRKTKADEEAESK